MNFEYFTYYVITAFSQTATTFTGQNHAAGQRERCKKILWLCLLLLTVCSSVLIFTIVLFRDFFSGLFTPDRAVIESAAVRIMCILLFEPICNLYEIPAGVLRGSGHALYPAAGTVIGTCAFRIIWILTVFQASPTLPMLYHAFPLSWVATILLVNAWFLVRKCVEKKLRHREKWRIETGFDDIVGGEDYMVFRQIGICTPTIHPGVILRGELLILLYDSYSDNASDCG